MILRWCTFNEATSTKQLYQDSAWHFYKIFPSLYSIMQTLLRETKQYRQQNNTFGTTPLFHHSRGLCGNLKLIFFDLFLMFFPKIWIAELGCNFFECVANIPVFTVKLSWQKKDNEETSSFLTQTKLVYVIKRCCNFCHIVWTPK